MKSRNYSMKSLNGFKRKNDSIFYDICINAIDKSNVNLYNKKDYIKEITALKTRHLNQNKKKQKNFHKKYFKKAMILRSRTLDDILTERNIKKKQEKEKVNSISTNSTSIENLPKIKDINEKKEKGNQAMKKYFLGKQSRYSIFKHITEYLESNGITINEIIENNPFQTKPYTLGESEEFIKATKFSEYEKVQSMLKKDNKLLFSIDYFGQTPYHWAAKLGDIKMMEILISFGKHHNQKDFKGRTPIYLAAVNNNKEMCKYLLDNYANPFIKNKENKSPADVAGSIDLKYFLKEHMSQPFNNPVYKLKLKNLLEKREGNIIKKRRLSGANKLIGVAQQLLDINRNFKK